MYVRHILWNIERLFFAGFYFSRMSRFFENPRKFELLGPVHFLFVLLERFHTVQMGFYFHFLSSIYYIYFIKAALIASPPSCSLLMKERNDHQ